jgi:hypothetical protein
MPASVGHDSHSEGAGGARSGWEFDISKKENNNDPVRWQKYCGRCFSQLEWWAEATRRHRELVDPFDESPAFVESPDQRNVQ